MQKMFRNQNFSETRKGSVTKLLGAVRQFFFPMKLVICRSYAYDFSVREVFWNKGGFPYESFQYCEKKTLTKYRDTPHLLLSKKIFDTRSFLKHRHNPPRNFWTLRDKKLIAPENVIPFLCVKFFETRFISETQKDSPTKTLGFVRQNLWQKSVIQPPLLLSIKFFGTRNFPKHRRFAPRIFSVVWDKNFDKKSWYTPSSLIHKISVSRNFLKQRRVPLRNFSVLWDKDFDKKSWYTPLVSHPKNFRYTDFSETQTCSPTKTLGSAGQKINSTKRQYPLLMRRIFR